MDNKKPGSQHVPVRLQSSFFLPPALSYNPMLQGATLTRGRMPSCESAIGLIRLIHHPAAEQLMQQHEWTRWTLRTHSSTSGRASRGGWLFGQPLLGLPGASPCRQTVHNNIHWRPNPLGLFRYGAFHLTTRWQVYPKGSWLDSRVVLPDQAHARASVARSVDASDAAI